MEPATAVSPSDASISLFAFTLLTFCLGLIEQALKLVPDDVVNLVLKIEVTKQKKRVPHFIAATTSRFVVLNIKAKVLCLQYTFFCLLSSKVQHDFHFLDMRSLTSVNDNEVYEEKQISFCLTIFKDYS